MYNVKLLSNQFATTLFEGNVNKDCRRCAQMCVVLKTSKMRQTPDPVISQRPLESTNCHSIMSMLREMAWHRAAAKSFLKLGSNKLQTNLSQARFPGKTKTPFSPPVPQDPRLCGPFHHLLHVVVRDLRCFLQVVDDGAVSTDHGIADTMDVTWKYLNHLQSIWHQVILVHLLQEHSICANLTS